MSATVKRKKRDNMLTLLLNVKNIPRIHILGIFLQVHFYCLLLSITAIAAEATVSACSGFACFREQRRSTRKRTASSRGLGATLVRCAIAARSLAHWAHPMAQDDRPAA